MEKAEQEKQTAIVRAQGEVGNPTRAANHGLAVIERHKNYCRTFEEVGYRQGIEMCCMCRLRVQP